MVLGLCLAWALTASAAPPHRQSSVLVLPGDGPRAVRELQLTARQLTYSPERGRVELNGGVTAGLGDLSLRCQRLVVKLDRHGQPLAIEAAGKVAIRHGAVRAVAAEARLLAAAGALVLEGDASLSTGAGGLVVHGKRIRLDLRDGRLAVDEARAMLSAGGRRGL